MNEILKKDLCARLPYGVKTYEKDSEEVGYFRLRHENFFAKTIQERKLKEIGLDYEVVFKPILFPISCLTKEITVNGKTFVPIIEIGKLHLGDLYHSFEVPREDKYCIGFNSKYGGWSFYNFNDYNSLPNWIIELFQKWHINYRLAPEQFIEATNEYE